MKKKKLSMLLLTMTLSALSLTGCGSGAGQTASQPSSTAASAEPTSSEPSETEPPSPETVPAKTKSPDGGQTVLNTMYLPDAAEDAGIYVEPIPDISDNFIRGMDVSSILVEEKSGVKYYSADGTEQDVFTTMAEAGVNYARIRVWNDPYDENGNGYGGETTIFRQPSNSESAPPTTA